MSGTRRRGAGHDRREQIVPAGRGSRSSRPGTSALLANYQAICLPYDGTKSLPCPARLPQAPLPAEGRGLLAAPRGGPDMKRASGIGHLKPFLPGLETLLERPGGLRDHDQRTRQRLDRARRPTRAPRGAGTHRRLAPPRRDPHRPAARPRSRRQTDPRCPSRGRLEGRHLHAAREPRGRHHHPPVRGPRVLGSGPGAHGLAAGDGPRGRPVGPLGPQEHPGLRRHGLGQDDAPQRADRVAARRRADRRHRGHARAQDRARQLPPLRGRGCRHRDLRLDPRPGAARAAPPARPHRRRRGAGAARPPICCRRSTPATAAR